MKLNCVFRERKLAGIRACDDTALYVLTEAYHTPRWPFAIILQTVEEANNYMSLDTVTTRGFVDVASATEAIRAAILSADRLIADLAAQCEGTASS